ncbi:hypothetical protein EDB83DRAFT_2313292 [Lactarius deliciosus]|nr:hypothetical protein EDB83DRAFT_2313292 [Lactarius deliciosus]
MARPKKKSKSTIQVTQDHGNGSRVMHFQLAVTTPSQVGDVLAFARSQSPVEELHLSVAAVAAADTSAFSVAVVATTDASTFSVATARAAAAQPSVTSIPYPLSRSTSPDNEFPNLGHHFIHRPHRVLALSHQVEHQAEHRVKSQATHKLVNKGHCIKMVLQATGSGVLHRMCGTFLQRMTRGDVNVCYARNKEMIHRVQGQATLENTLLTVTGMNG